MDFVHIEDVLSEKMTGKDIEHDADIAVEVVDLPFIANGAELVAQDTDMLAVNFAEIVDVARQPVGGVDLVFEPIAREHARKRQGIGRRGEGQFLDMGGHDAGDPVLDLCAIAFPEIGAVEGVIDIGDDIGGADYDGLVVLQHWHAADRGLADVIRVDMPEIVDIDGNPAERNVFLDKRKQHDLAVEGRRRVVQDQIGHGENAVPQKDGEADLSCHCRG